MNDDKFRDPDDFDGRFAEGLAIGVFATTILLIGSLAFWAFSLTSLQQVAEQVLTQFWV